MVFTSKSVGTGPSSCEKIIYRVAVSHRLRNFDLDDISIRELVNVVQGQVQLRAVVITVVNSRVPFGSGVSKNRGPLVCICKLVYAKEIAVIRNGRCAT